jgi:hypothetical protein
MSRDATTSDPRDIDTLGIGVGGMWEEIVAFGVPRLSPATRIRALEEAINT